MVVGVVVLVVMVKLVRSMGWRRVVAQAAPAFVRHGCSRTDDEDGRRPGDEALSVQLASVSVADPSTEPDPRRR